MCRLGGKMKTIADTTVIGTGAAAHVYLQTFNLVLSAIIGILTVLYAFARVRNELLKSRELKKDDDGDS